MEVLPRKVTQAEIDLGIILLQLGGLSGLLTGLAIGFFLAPHEPGVAAAAGLAGEVLLMGGWFLIVHGRFRGADPPLSRWRASGSWLLRAGGAIAAASGAWLVVPSLVEGTNGDAGSAGLSFVLVWAVGVAGGTSVEAAFIVMRRRRDRVRRAANRG
jgi:hypothetical protein